jgi:hypothetical protein
MPREKFDEMTVEFKGDGQSLPYVVYGWGEYEESSVLAGQTRKVFINAFETEQAAREAYPQCSGGTNGRSANNSVAHLPGENDPVAGGMFPDDYEDGI